MREKEVEEGVLVRERSVKTEAERQRKLALRGR